MPTVALDSLSSTLLDAAGEIITVADDPAVAAAPASGNTQQSQYAFEVYDASGALLADLSPYAQSRHFTVRRNRAEQVSVVFDQGILENLASSLGITARQLLEPGVNEIKIRRGNRYLLGSQISYILPRLSATSRMIELRAVGYLDLFKDRFLYPSDAALTQTSADIGAVAWAFINTSQSRTNGSFGITSGTIQTSRTITDTWQPYATSIRDILIALTERHDSIDFEFSYDKQFRVYYPGMGVTHNDIVFSFPGNIKELAMPIDASELCNVAIERGSGNGDQQVVETRPDTSSQATYKLREAIDDYPSINVTTTLDEKGDEHLRKNATPTIIPDITLDGNIEPFLGSYWVGDRVPVSVARSAGSMFAPLDGQTWRINELDVTLDQNDDETIKLKVGYA